MNPLFLILLSFLCWCALGGERNDPNPIGCNIDGVDFRARTQPFVNLIRQAQPFMSTADKSQKATVDANGWPTEDFSVALQTLGIDLIGDYSIQCQGKATVASMADGKITKQNYDPSTNTLTATLSISEKTASDIALQFTGTSSGVKNISVLLPEFSQAQANDINPLVIEQMKTRCSVVRYLAMLPVQRDIVRTWSERALPKTNPSWTTFCCPLERNDSSVPYEEIIRIANAVGVDIWLPLQVVADDDYYIQLATLLKNSLNSDINVYFEIGNEMWYGSYGQYQMELQANQSVTKNGDPYKLNYDNVNSELTWGRRLLAYKTAIGVPSLFEKVFPNDVGYNKRIRPQLSCQTGYVRYLEELFGYLDTAHPGSIQNLHGLHLAMYFGLGRDLENKDNLTEDQILDALSASLNSTVPHLYSTYYSYATVAAWYGIDASRFRGYEGGPDTFNGHSIPGKVAANLSPKMQDLVWEMYQIWHSYGFNDLNYWHFGANTYDWEWGQWTIQTSMHDANTPKVKALDSVRTHPRPKSVLGLSLPLKNHWSAQYVGYRHTNNTPTTIMWIEYGVVYYYPLKAEKAGDYSLTVNIATGLSTLTNCSIEIGTSSGDMKTPFITQLKISPTPSRTEFQPQGPVKIPISTTLTALRLRPMLTEGCYFVKGPNKIVHYGIGAFSIS